MSVEQPPLRVIVADDNLVVRAGLTALLAARPDVEVVGEAVDGRQACEVTAAHRPDAVLLDARMPGMSGLSALPYLAGIAPVLMLMYRQESGIVHEAVRRGASGYLVHGEFTAEQLVAAIREVASGRASLTPTAATALLAQIRRHAPLHSQQFPSHASQVQRDMGQSWYACAGLDRTERTERAARGVPAGHGLSQREAEVMELIAGGMSNRQIAAACFISEKTVKNHINRIFGKLHASSRSQAIALWLGTAKGPVSHD